VGRPEKSDEEAVQHLLRSDPVRRFMVESLERVSGEFIEYDMMTAAYESWCIAERITKPLGPSKLAAALEERGIDKERFVIEGRGRVTGYRGWRLRATLPVWPAT
jgi:hypothetical protein